MDLMTLLRSQWDRVAAGILAVVGLILLIVGYHGVAHSAYVADELSYVVSGGLGGLFCLGAAATLFVSADLHDEWRKLDRIEEAIRATGAGAFPDVSDLQAVSKTEFEAAGSTNGHASVAGSPPPSRRSRTRGATAARVDQGLMSRLAVPRGGPLAVAGANRRDSFVAGPLALPAAVRDSLRLSGAGMGLGLLGLVLAWVRVASVSPAKPAINAASAAAAALVVAGVASATGTLSLKRKIAARQAWLLAPWTRVLAARDRAALHPAAMRDETTAPTLEAPPTWLVIDGGTYAHRSGCPMLTSARSVTEVPGRAALPVGVRLCAMCSSS
jgi:hypothetical protein